MFGVITIIAHKKLCNITSRDYSTNCIAALILLKFAFLPQTVTQINTQTLSVIQTGSREETVLHGTHA